LFNDINDQNIGISVNKNVNNKHKKDNYEFLSFNLIIKLEFFCSYSKGILIFSSYSFCLVYVLSIDKDISVDRVCFALFYVMVASQ
jgi:hypothetical protein